MELSDFAAILPRVWSCSSAWRTLRFREVSSPFTPSRIVAGGRRPVGRERYRVPAELGPLNAMGRNQWFANFNNAGDDYVIKSGLASGWMTVAP